MLSGVVLSARVQDSTPVRADEEVVPIGPGVKPPSVIHKVEPEYSRAAREAKVQGSVLLELVVDENGVPSDISVLNPLGFGLDENAERAVSRWRFKPGMQDGVPVRVAATVQVNFRLMWPFDSNAEKQRTSFNQTLLEVRGQKDGKPTPKQLKVIERLSAQDFPPAEYLLAVWQLSSLINADNRVDGLALLEKAIRKKYAPALLYSGVMNLEGKFVPRDPGKGLTLVREAADLGSERAQHLLAGKYETGETGEGVERDLDSSIKYYRLCAASGVATCEFRLGQLLLTQYRGDDLHNAVSTSPKLKRRTFLEALAWLGLAADRGVGEAKKIVEEESEHLTEDDAKWVSRVQGQLEHRGVQAL